MADLRDTSSAKQGIAITPSNNAFEPCRAVFVGTSGNLSVVFSDSPPTATPVVLVNVPAGYNPLSVRKITSTLGGATDIVALY